MLECNTYVNENVFLTRLFSVVLQVGYEAGSCGERLPDIYMNDLDSELIPVMHRATQQNHVGTVLELIFHVLN